MDEQSKLPLVEQLHAATTPDQRARVWQRVSLLRHNYAHALDVIIPAATVRRDAALHSDSLADLSLSLSLIPNAIGESRAQ